MVEDINDMMNEWAKDDSKKEVKPLHSHKVIVHPAREKTTEFKKPPKHSSFMQFMYGLGVFIVIFVILGNIYIEDEESNKKDKRVTRNNDKIRAESNSQVEIYLERGSSSICVAKYDKNDTDVKITLYNRGEFQEYGWIRFKAYNRYDRVIGKGREWIRNFAYGDSQEVSTTLAEVNASEIKSVEIYYKNDFLDEYIYVGKCN